MPALGAGDSGFESLHSDKGKNYKNKTSQMLVAGLHSWPSASGLFCFCNSSLCRSERANCLARGRDSNTLSMSHAARWPRGRVRRERCTGPVRTESLPLTLILPLLNIQKKRYIINMKQKHHHYAMTLIILLGLVTIIVAIIVGFFLEHKRFENPALRNVAIEAKI